MITYRVREFRNGVQIGAVTRDVQFVVRQCSGNTAPTATGVNGTNNYTITKNRVEGNKKAGIVVILWPFGKTFDPNNNKASPVTAVDAFFIVALHFLRRMQPRLCLQFRRIRWLTTVK